MKKVLIERTKKGLSCSLGKVVVAIEILEKPLIIGNIDGQPKKAVYVRRRGQLANGNHVLVILEVGDYIVEADHHREDFEISVLKVLGFEEKEEETYAVVEQVNHFSSGEWDTELPDFLLRLWYM